MWGHLVRPGARWGYLQTTDSKYNNGSGTVQCMWHWQAVFRGKGRKERENARKGSIIKALSISGLA